MSEFRLDKLGEQIREEISSLIMTGKIKDPRVSTFLSINRVEVSGDLSYAKVFVSSFLDSNKVKQGIKGLESATGFIHSTLSRKLRLRQFPHLSFIFDESIKEGFEMIKKIDSLDITYQEPSDGDKS